MQNDLLQQDRQDLLASEEWQKLLRHFEFSPGFAWIILLVRDSNFGRLCFAELQSVLQAKAGLNLSALPIAQPKDLETAVEKLLSIDPANSPLWIAGVGTPEAYRSAWERCAMKLNRTRDTIASRFPHALIFVMQPWTREVLRDEAPDFWSVHDTVVDLSTILRQPTIAAGNQAPKNPDQQDPNEWSPDPDLALAQAVRLRGKPGLESTLLRVLDRAGTGLMQRGRSAEAEQVYGEALGLTQAALEANPNHVDLLRGRAVALDRSGHLHFSLGQFDQALPFAQESLTIRRRLASAEPNRADLQRELSVSLERLGEIYLSLGQIDRALSSEEECLDIRRHLAAAEPNRTDLQRDLSVSLNGMSELYAVIGQFDRAISSAQESLDIRQALATTEPNRADLQRDLAASFTRLSDLHLSLGQADQALSFAQQALAIAQRLTAAEPNRADLQRDLAVSHLKLSESDPTNSRTHLQQALEILQMLVDQNRLNPADATMPAELQRLLAALPQPPASLNE